ncbi:putative ribosomal N-acetyltransferase YdaF [Fulvitalea axinellae]|uniref:Ribosomal N-acetyltransferase YdaF n=1 Tax=Fulvitalea axinellae TaxID=1182444 RepID=A0AAU9CZR6_9BACT|nr:putative ribosomal N-acetyltransferase YdaF [Fulvitalea axinellae]
MSTTVSPCFSLKTTDPTIGHDFFQLVESNRSRLSKWFDWPNAVKSPQEAERYLKKVKEAESRFLRANFMIHSNGSIIGMAGLGHLDILNKKSDIYYWIDEKHEGQGIISSTCKHILHFGFSKMRLNRICIYCATDNARSITVPERLGFTYEGTLRKAEKLNGNFNDLRLYSMLNEEWTSS